MNGDTVKTGLLKALETLLQGVEGISTVYRDYYFPVDLAPLHEDPIPLPALFFYEDLEDLKKAGRLMMNILHLDLACFDAFTGPVENFKSQAWTEFKDKMDQVAGRIHNLLLDPAALGPLHAAGLIKVEEVGNRKAPCNETYGEMVLTIRLTYGHALGDAFNTQVS